jgi:hypothetical protein
MLAANNIRPAARAALLLLAAARRHPVYRGDERVERRVLSTRQLAGRMGIKPSELAPVMHCLATTYRRPHGTAIPRGFVERAYTGSRESYSSVTWALVEAPEVEALIAELGAEVGPGSLTLDLAAIREDIDRVLMGPRYQWSHA